MTLRQIVIDLIGQRGRASVDDLLPELAPMGYTRKQVLRAMHKGCEKKELECLGYSRVEGHRGGSVPSDYQLAEGYRTSASIKPTPARASAPLPEEVAKIVITMGQATVDDIQSKFPRVARADLHKALRAANVAGHIRTAKKGSGPGHPTVWKSGHVPQVQKPLVASVWELASPRFDWPRTEGGMVYRPLGEWNQEEVAA